MNDVEALNCQELVELVTDYLEGALDPRRHRLFEEHLSVCDACCVYVEQLRETVTLVGTITPDDLSPEAEKVLLEAFRGWRRSS